MDEAYAETIKDMLEKLSRDTAHLAQHCVAAEDGFGQPLDLARLDDQIKRIVEKSMDMRMMVGRWMGHRAKPVQP